MLCSANRRDSALWPRPSRSNKQVSDSSQGFTVSNSAQSQDITAAADGEPY
jgi:hypothetical protein